MHQERLKCSHLLIIKRPYKGKQVTTVSVRELKARASEILRNLESSGEEVIITRRGKPCGKLVPIKGYPQKKQSLRSVRDSLTFLPDLGFEEIQALIKSTWEEPGHLP
jgi:prevent-host-death family protein